VSVDLEPFKESSEGPVVELFRELGTAQDERGRLIQEELADRQWR
jgi:hypothetical protein